MEKEYIEVKIPILNNVEEMEVVKTFSQEQLWYVCAIAKAYEKLEDNWKKLKEYVEETKIKEFEKTFGKRYNKTFTQAEIIVCNMIKNKMKELERGVSDD